MKPEEVATIAVRLLGLIIVLVMLNSVLRIALVLISLLAALTTATPDPIGHRANALETLVASGGFIAFALGLYMFFSGRWFIRRIVRGLGPPPEGICPACEYDLAGLRVSRCPECGEKLPKGVVRATEVAAREHRSQKDSPRAS